MSDPFWSHEGENTFELSLSLFLLCGEMAYVCVQHIARSKGGWGRVVVCCCGARDYVNIKAVTFDSRRTSSLQTSNIESCTRFGLVCTALAFARSIPQRVEREKSYGNQSFIKSGKCRRRVTSRAGCLQIFFRSAPVSLYTAQRNKGFGCAGFFDVFNLGPYLLLRLELLAVYV